MSNTRANQTNRIRKNKYCKKCKTTTHSIKDCFYLFPKKTLKGFKTKYNYKPKDQEALISINTSDNPPSNKEDDFELELELDLMDTDQEFITGQVLVTN